MRRNRARLFSIIVLFLRYFILNRIAVPHFFMWKDVVEYNSWEKKSQNFFTQFYSYLWLLQGYVYCTYCNVRLLITVESGDLWWETSELGNVLRANFDHVLIDIFNVKLFYLETLSKRLSVWCHQMITRNWGKLVQLLVNKGFVCDNPWQADTLVIRSLDTD